MEYVVKGVLSVILTYTTHYGVSKMYDIYCVPNGVLGYLHGFITTGSPVCKGALHVISSTQVSYSNVITLGVSRFVLDWFAPGSSVVMDATTSS
jgi:hypothetical protein